VIQVAKMLPLCEIAAKQAEESDLCSQVCLLHERESGTLPKTGFTFVMSLDKTEKSFPPGDSEAARGLGQVGSSESAPDAGEAWPLPPARSCFLLASIVLAYMGVYLCRKNLSVAIPMIQKAFGVNKAQTGDIISYSAAAYAVGKFLFGPIIDRFGGRISLLLVMAGVAVFGGLGAFSGSIPMLVLCYSANRFCGSAGWGAIVKLTPAWFPQRHWALAMAFLSLSFVFGGIVALLLAGQIAAWSGDNWRMVMGLPSLVLLALLLIMWRILPSDRLAARAGRSAAGTSGFNAAYMIRLLKIPQLWVLCGMAFSLYIMRETFNDWTVDFFKTEGGAGMTSQVAAALSTPFDAAGAVGIVLLGWMFDRLKGRPRTIVLFGTLALLAVLVYWLPSLYKLGLWQVETTIGLIGFLSYGPYSLLAGVLAVEIGGRNGVGTVAGLVDSSGYLATVFAGHVFGGLLDRGGYTLGFHVLAVVTLASAFLCLGLKSNQTIQK
jgi:MFS transporter, OPA family, glycerol-3-phosphate transporter